MLSYKEATLFNNIQKNELISRLNNENLLQETLDHFFTQCNQDPNDEKMKKHFEFHLELAICTNVPLTLKYFEHIANTEAHERFKTMATQNGAVEETFEKFIVMYLPKGIPHIKNSISYQEMKFLETIDNLSYRVYGQYPLHYKRSRTPNAQEGALISLSNTVTKKEMDFDFGFDKTWKYKIVSECPETAEELKDLLGLYIYMARNDHDDFKDFWQFKLEGGFKSYKSTEDGLDSFKAKKQEFDEKFNIRINAENFREEFAKMKDDLEGYWNDYNTFQQLYNMKRHQNLPDE